MTLTDFHVFENSVRWRLTRSGVDIEGSGVERTKGAPRTVTAVWDAYGKQIDTAAKAYRVPAELIVATVCTESGGRADAVREEPGYTSDQATPHRVSIGLTQTLLSTAREAMNLSFGRDWLLVPANAITAGTAYIAGQARQTSLDPPLVAAAYNAGRLRHQDGAENRWKLRQFPIGTGKHVDRFVRFFNDAVDVLYKLGTRPSVCIDALLGDTPPRPRQQAPQSGAPTVRWGDNARGDTVPPHALGVLQDIARAAGLSDVLVSSTQRTPKDQARVMYDNCRRHGPDSQRQLYSKYGDQVIDVYVTEAADGADPQRVRAAMEDKIMDLGPANVSRHTADPRVLTVIDVAPSSVRDKVAFERAVKADRRVKTFLLPPTDPAYHLEIPAPRP
jgi:Transglycosylase SLT domain